MPGTGSFCGVECVFVEAKERFCILSVWVVVRRLGLLPWLKGL